MGDFAYKPEDIKIDFINVPSTSGRIGMCQCPGIASYNLVEDLRVIKNTGTVALISLMCDREYKIYGVSDLSKLIPDGIKHYQLEIIDNGTPDANFESQWKINGPDIRFLLKQGSTITIHCYAGLGRTGLLTARLLVEFGISPSRAIKIVRQARPGAIQNYFQETYLLKRRWEDQY